MSLIFNFLSGEWMFFGLRYPNGGIIVFLRGAWVTLWLLVFYLIVSRFFGLPLDFSPSTHDNLFDVFLKIAGIFAGVYTAFYVRFSSQWTYMAGLYNAIKAVEAAEGANLDSIAEWKAGYIEDAIDLHLASKDGVLGVIRAWTSTSESVKEKFLRHTPNAEEKWRRLDCLICCRR